MDVPLATNNIGIQHGFKGYRRKSSTFCQMADVGGLFVFFDWTGLNCNDINNYLHK